MKECWRCHLPKDLSEFGANRSRPDGKAVYCFPCNRLFTNEFRQRQREYKKHRKMFINKQPTLPYKTRETRAATSSLHLAITARRVQAVIAEGSIKWDTLRRRTRLTNDQLGLAIAELLLDRRSIRSKTINGERFYMRVA